jgi:hypothetical protein
MSILGNESFNVDEELKKTEEIQEESSLGGDIFKGGVTGRVDPVVKTVNYIIDGVDEVLYGGEYSDIRLTPPSEDPLITETITGGTAYEVTGDIARTIVGGGFLRGTTGLKGGSSLLGRATANSVTDALASGMLNDMNQEGLLFKTEANTVERKAFNVLEDAIIGVGVEAGLGSLGKGFKAFKSWAKSSDAEEALKQTGSAYDELVETVDMPTDIKVSKGSELVDELNPNVTARVAEDTVPSVSLVGTDRISDDLATKNRPFWELPVREQEIYYARKVGDYTRRELADLQKQIDDLEAVRITKGKRRVVDKRNRSIDEAILKTRKAMEDLNSEKLRDIDEFVRHPKTLRKHAVEALSVERQVLKELTTDNASNKVKAIKAQERKVALAELDLRLAEEALQTAKDIRYSRHMEKVIQESKAPEKIIREQKVQKVREQTLVESVPPNIDAKKLVKDTNSIAKAEIRAQNIADQDQLLIARAVQGKIPEGELDILDDYLRARNGNTGTKDQRLNPATNGDNDDVPLTKFADDVTTSQNFKKVKKTQRKSVYEAFKELKATGVPPSLKEFQLEMGMSDDTILRNLAVVKTVTDEAEKVLLQARVLRTRVVREARESVEKVLLAGDNATGEQIAETARLLGRLNELDSSLYGAISQTARNLRLQQLDPHQLQSKLLRAQTLALDVTEETAERGVKNLAGSVTADMTKAERKELMSLFKKIRKSKMQPSDIDKAMKNHTLLDYHSSYIAGGLLSDPRTVTRSVFLATLANYFNKTFLDQISQRILAGGGREGTIIGEIAQRNSNTNIVGDLWEQGIKPTLQGRHAYEGMLNRMSKDTASEYEGGISSIVKWKDLLNKIDEDIVSAEAGGRTGRALRLKLAKYPTAVFMYPANRARLGIGNIDAIFREATTNSELDSVIYRRWNRDGGDSIFSTKMSYQEYKNQYRSLYLEHKKVTDAFNNSEIDIDDYLKRIDEVYIGVHPELKESMIQEVEEITTKVNRISDEVTLQEDISETSIGQILNSINKNANGNKLAEFSVTLMQPFVKSPTNNLRNIIEYSPLAPTSKRWRRMFAEGGDARNEVLARTLTGTGMISGAVALAHSVDIVGRTIPPEYREHQGIRPYSIRIGDSWPSFDRLGQASALLGVVADLKNNGWSGELSSAEDATFLTHIFTLGATLYENSAVGGWGELLEALSTEHKLENFVIDKTTMAVTPVAGAQRFFSDVVDPNEMKDYNLEQIEAHGDLRDAIEDFYVKAMNKWSNQPFSGAIGEAVGDVLSIEGGYDTRYDALDRVHTKNNGSLLGRVLFYFGINNKLANTDPAIGEMARLGKIPKLRRGETYKTDDGLHLSYSDHRRYTNLMYRGESGVLNTMRNRMLSAGSNYFDEDYDRSSAWDSVMSSHKIHAQSLIEGTSSPEARDRTYNHWLDSLNNANKKNERGLTLEEIDALYEVPEQ